jgi:CHAD domain-containing protein/CYTH domain-containing protein
MALPSDILLRSAEEAARRIALEFLAEARTASLRLDDSEDAEALHDFRVAVRRLRSTARAWRGELRKSISKRHRRGLRAVQTATGGGRDAEVALEWLADQRSQLRGQQRRGLVWLTHRLEQRRSEAMGRVCQEVRAEFDDLHDDLRNCLEVMSIETHLAQASEPQVAFADELARKARGYANDLARLLEEVSSPDDEGKCHRTRISGKRLRYLLEPVRAQVEGASGIVRKCKSLQDVLGDLNDAHVLLRELGTAVEDAGAEHAQQLYALAREGDGEQLRREARRSARPGLLELTRLVQQRIENLYAELERDWIEGGVHVLVDDVERMAALLERIAHAGVEIERKYLLRGLPDLDDSTDVVEIHRGWLPGELLRERIRRVRSDDATTYFRTIKLGHGVERIEIEEPTSEEVFDRLWPLTKDCRIRKRRYRVPEGDLVWEIDEFLDRDLHLAEVELESASQNPEPPRWLAPHVVREVTDDPRYTNLALAEQGESAPRED